MLKSFLHQSSDICRAINEAWEQSEKPAVFTVKIIDPGKKGFLGFSHRDAIISFTYECSQPCVKPLNQLRQVAEKEATASNKNSKAELRQLPANREAKKTPAKPAEKPKAVEPQPTREVAKAQDSRNSRNRPKTSPKSTPTKEECATQVTSTGNEVWNETLSSAALTWLEGFFKVFGEPVEVKVAELNGDLLVLSVSGTGLADSFIGGLFKDNLFACACATLIVQSLRNKNSQRFKGLKIKIIT